MSRTQLTRQQIAVLERLARGLSEPQTAWEMFLSHNTIKTHTQRLRERLGARNNTHALALALAHRHLVLEPLTGPAPRLQRSQLETLRMVTWGMENREMAQRLGLSYHTVHQRTTNMNRRLGAQTRAQAVALAFRHGLVTPATVLEREDDAA